jgi:uncharacterized protein (TIGR00290 family)
MTRRVLLAWSGGKDSALTLATLQAMPDTEVVGLLTTVTADYGRIRIHGVRREILHAQSQSIGISVIEATLRVGGDNNAYDRAWSAGIDAARERCGDFDAIAYGDLFLEDVRAFRIDQSERLGYTPMFPLWGRDTREVAESFIDAGFVAYLSCVDTTQAPAELAGRRFDRALLAELPESVDPCGERGEFHSCVVAGPPFREALSVRVGERVLRDGRFEYCDLLLES